MHSPFTEARSEPVNADLPWRIEGIELGDLQPQAVRDDEQLFFMLACASFIESGSDLYTRNLVEHYRRFPDTEEWLVRRWEKEELQHGRALRGYIQMVWPGYDWEAAFRRFFADYGPRCSMEELEPSPALEMAARCVVETGTATYSRMLFEAT